MKITNIVWDIDDEDREDAEARASLPAEVIIDDETVDDEDIADFLSDKFGWCVKSFYIERTRKG